MDGKRKSVAVATEGVAQAALRRGTARELSADEEKVLRMRLGAALPHTEPLERVCVRTDDDIDLLAYEIEAWLKFRDRQRAPPRATPTADPCTKAKIVRALRKKR